MHDIHTTLFLAAQLPDLLQPGRNYTAHRLRLLYIAVTKGWPAALYCDHQGANEYLDVRPHFCTGYQPPRPRASLQFFKLKCGYNTSYCQGPWGSCGLVRHVGSQRIPRRDCSWWSWGTSEDVHIQSPPLLWIDVVVSGRKSAMHSAVISWC
jgi:hypothetical protein